MNTMAGQNQVPPFAQEQADASSSLYSTGYSISGSGTTSQWLELSRLSTGQDSQDLSNIEKGDGTPATSSAPRQPSSSIFQNAFRARIQKDGDSDIFKSSTGFAYLTHRAVPNNIMGRIEDTPQAKIQMWKLMEVRSEEIELGDELGRGSSGAVYQAVFRGSRVSCGRMEGGRGEEGREEEGGEGRGRKWNGGTGLREQPCGGERRGGGGQGGGGRGGTGNTKEEKSERGKGREKRDLSDPSSYRIGARGCRVRDARYCA